MPYPGPGPAAPPPGAVPVPHAPGGPVPMADQSQWLPPPGVPVPGGGEGSPCAADGGGYCCPADWSFEEGARILARSRTRSLNISNEFSVHAVQDPDNEDQLINTRFYSDPVSTKALSFDAAAGYYATLTHYLGRDMSNRDQFVDFSYWGLNKWDVHLTRAGNTQPVYANNDPYDPDSPPSPVAWVGSLQSFFEQVDDALRPVTADEKVISDGFSNALKHDLYYTSEINNFEVNGWLRPRGRPDRLVLYPNGRWRRERETGQYLSYMAGLRLLMIDERFDFFSEGETQTASQYVATSGSYRIRTNNDLFGFQIGGELMFRDRLWEWGARYKLGPFVNFADQTSDIIGRRRIMAGADDDLPSVGAVYRKAHKYEVSGLAEVGVEGTYKITPHLSFHAAYDWLFITGLALAPEQIDYRLTAASNLNNNGHVMYHGLTLGLEWLW